MAYNFYLTIPGISGDDGTLGDPIGGLQFSYDTSQPYDPGSGRLTGRRQHQPIRIVREIDKASPQFLQAMISQKPLQSVLISFGTPGTAPTMTAQLTLATIVDVAYYTEGSSATDRRIMPADASPRNLEEIAFVFEKIVYTWADGGITATDDWEARG